MKTPIMANVTTRVLRISPYEAKRMLEMNTSNRPLRDKTVDYYANQMRKGLWRMNGEPIIISSDNTILDGQHRLMAIIQSGMTIEMLVVSGIDPITFSTIDTGMIRTPKDIFSIAGIPDASTCSAIVSQYFVLSNSNKNILLPGNHGRREKNTASKQEMLSFFRSNQELVIKAASLSRRCYQKKRLLGHSTIGAYTLYLAINKRHPLDSIVNFFEQLAEFKPEENSTIKILRDALVSHKMKIKILPPAKIEAFVIKTWNAYITGKEYKILTYNPNIEGKLSFI